MTLYPYQVQKVALLAEGVDRNLFVCFGKVCNGESPSSRRAWIEIRRRQGSSGRGDVALLAEGVDRNLTVAAALAG